MRKMFKLGDKAVSQVIGYVLTFAIISATTVTVVYTTSVLLERRATAAAEIIAQDIANHVVDAITECIAMKQEFPDANYSRVINVPTTINGKNYYIVATDERVYVNTTDGKVSAKSTTYKQSELCIGISGKVYPSSGKIKVYVNKSDYLYRIDFGTDTSPGSMAIHVLVSHPCTEMHGGISIGVTVLIYLLIIQTRKISRIFKSG